MTISKNSDFILAHPFLKEAVRKYALGDSGDLAHLIRELTLHTYLTVAANCGRAYKSGLSAGFTNPIVLGMIKDVAPPENLDIRLPIPKVREVCRVIPIRRKGVDPMQLRIDFTQKPPKVTVCRPVRSA